MLFQAPFYCFKEIKHLKTFPPRNSDSETFLEMLYQHNILCNDSRNAINQKKHENQTKKPTKNNSGNYDSSLADDVINSKTPKIMAFLSVQRNDYLVYCGQNKVLFLYVSLTFFSGSKHTLCLTDLFGSILCGFHRCQSVFARRDQSKNQYKTLCQNHDWYCAYIFVYSCLLRISYSISFLTTIIMSVFEKHRSFLLWFHS